MYLYFCLYLTICFCVFGEGDIISWLCDLLLCAMCRWYLSFVFVFVFVFVSFISWWCDLLFSAGGICPACALLSLSFELWLQSGKSTPSCLFQLNIHFSLWFLIQIVNFFLWNFSLWFLIFSLFLCHFHLFPLIPSFCAVLFLRRSCDCKL